MGAILSGEGPGESIILGVGARSLSSRCHLGVLLDECFICSCVVSLETQATNMSLASLCTAMVGTFTIYNYLSFVYIFLSYCDMLLFN